MTSQQGNSLKLFLTVELFCAEGMNMVKGNSSTKNNPIFHTVRPFPCSSDEYVKR